MDITVTNLTIEDISKAIRNELRGYFEQQEEKEREDEIGGIELAIELTGLAKPTIYGLVSERKIPHSKRGKKLYFSRKELLIWLTNGKRKTQDEIAAEAIIFDVKRKEAIPSAKSQNRFQKSKRQS
ncbi:MAG: helix-turn-helix domain-containing protein [Acidobacteriota bacterium]|nr:helix-turn-helix domain-containing protein [Acidobacteriota bacterium]